MIQRPPEMGAFQFVVLAALRTKQLTRGCVPRVGGNHKLAITAQLEVAEGKVTALDVAVPGQPPAVVPVTA